MGWDIEFVGQLNHRSLHVRYKLEFVGLSNSLGQPFILREDIGAVQIETRSVRITGSRVIPQRWSVSFGGFSLRVSGDIRAILPKMRRGQVAVLLCSINQGSFRNLSIGCLHNISGQRGLFRLEFKDLLSGLQNSLDTNAGTFDSLTDLPHFTLFYNVGRTTLTTAQFGHTDTILQVEDASFFKKNSQTKGIAKVIANDQSFEYYILWDTATSTQLQGITNISYNNKVRDLTDAGATVVYCAWLRGEPYEILASIITSTGTGINGEFDVYPKEWSIGGGIDKRIFDISDARRASKEIVRENNDEYILGYAVETPLRNGLRAIVDIFSTVGIFPVYRQDAISIRACTDPEGVRTNISPDLRGIISDADIIDVISHDFFSPDISNVYRTSRIRYTLNNTYYRGGVYADNKIDSLPAVEQIERDFSLYYRGASTTTKLQQASQDNARLRVWDLYISERLVIKLPLRFAVLVAGDIVTFRSDFVEHLYDPPDPIYKGRFCMVLGCDYSIDAQECIVTLGIPSPKSQGSSEPAVSDNVYSGWEPNTTYNNTQMFIWLSSDVDLNADSNNDITTWVDRQNSFIFESRAGSNNTYNTGGGSPRYVITGGGGSNSFYYAQFRHTNHQFLATTFNSKMDLSNTDGICIAMLVRASNDPIGDVDFNGATYYKAPLVNCGRAYQFHFLDSFSGTTYTDAIGFDNNTNTFHRGHVIAPPDSNWKIIIYSAADVGGYTNEEGLYVNGIRVNTSDYVGTNADMSITPDFRLGRDPDINYTNQTQQFDHAFGSFDLAELLMFSIPLHDSERQKVEGYIAHKFNLTILLPTTHPYKNTVPT